MTVHVLGFLPPTWETWIVFDSRFTLDSVLAITAIWGVNQKMGALYLFIFISITLPQIILKHNAKLHRIKYIKWIYTSTTADFPPGCWKVISQVYLKVTGPQGRGRHWVNSTWGNCHNFGRTKKPDFDFLATLDRDTSYTPSLMVFRAESMPVVLLVHGQ